MIIFNYKRTLFWVITTFALLSSCSPEQQEIESTETNDTLKGSYEVIKNEDINRQMRYYGTFSPINSFDVISEVAGEIKSVNVDKGSKVFSQTVLARVDNFSAQNSLNQAAAALEQTKASLITAQANWEKDSILYTEKSISEIAYKNSLSAITSSRAALKQSQASYNMAKRNFDKTVIRPAFKGTVTAKFANPGAFATQGARLFSVADMSTMILTVFVDEKSVINLKKGAACAVYFANREVDGIIKTVARESDPQTRTFAVEIEVSNENEVILSGMSGEAILCVESFRDVTTVPASAIIKRGGETLVLAVEGNSSAKEVKVEIIERIGQRVAFASILKQGDKVIVDGIENYNPSMVWQLEEAKRGR